MPPRKRIFREDILKAAVQLVQEEGTAALSVRNIARTLRCSTQPIYSEFENMETAGGTGGLYPGTLSPGGRRQL